MLFTRGLVNKNIIFHDHVDVNTVTRSYEQFSSLVDAYKNLFLSRGGGRGRSVVIGTQSCTEQIALVLACAELGMIVTIVPNPYPVVGDAGGPAKTVYTPGLISKHYQTLLPVDFFVVISEQCTDKYQVFKDTCRLTIELAKETLDFTPNNTILATPNSIFLKCPSSGTTGTPKTIEHTHEFFSALITRNGKMFSGSMGLLTNLAHGSSPGTYFLPGLVAENVKEIHNFLVPNNSLVELALYCRKNNLSTPNHVMVSYTTLIDEFFNSDETLGDCIIYTLGVIRQNWVNRLKGKARDIISIFGSNETSGPTLINQATDSDFAENSHKVIDDFYKFNLTDRDELEVLMPVYGNTINTKDKFAINDNGKYVHKGRSNLYRINDLEINQTFYQELIDKEMKADLIIDTVKDRIYLAVWDSLDENLIKSIDDTMRRDSNNRHFLSAYDKLTHNDFLSGIKLDREALRDYFRRKLSLI